MKFENLLNNEFKEKIKKDKEIIAVLIFGSYVNNRAYSRDIDVCLVLDKKYSNYEMTGKAIKYASLLPSKFDISIFQQLPVYIQKSVLRGGKIIICKNEDKLYEIAYSTIKEFESFKYKYESYLENALYK